MRTHTHLNKLTIALAIAALAATPAALAAPRDARSPDTREAALTIQQHQTEPADRRSPDTIDTARATQRLAASADRRSPDTIDTARATQHLAASADRRSPDTVDAARATHPPSTRAPLTAAVDRRSPATIDAALATETLNPTTIHTPGFQWAAFGIGAAAAISAMLILALSIKLLAARQTRKQPNPVATA
jgi:hypothetical protein